MADLCQHCGFDREPDERAVERGPLRIMIASGALEWHGTRVKLPPRLTRILIPLVRSGWATHDQILAYGNEDWGVRNLHNALSDIRSVLRDANIPVLIEAEWGEGYRLTIGDEMPVSEREKHRVSNADLEHQLQALTAAVEKLSGLVNTAFVKATDSRARKSASPIAKPTREALRCALDAQRNATSTPKESAT